MRRNLDRRVEAVAPIDSPKHRKKLEELLKLYLNDNREYWEMQSDGSFIQRQPKTEIKSAQKSLIELWQKEQSTNT